MTLWPPERIVDGFPRVKRDRIVSGIEKMLELATALDVIANSQTPEKI